MSIVNATYFANYEDYNGFDSVPCKVDTDRWEVISFGNATECRWFEDVNVMCIEEGIRFEDGIEIEVFKFDEYFDRVKYDGDTELEEAYKAGQIVLYDHDELEDAMSEFEENALTENMYGLDFITCKPRGVPGLPADTSTVADDVHDAAEHMKRAIRTMKKNNNRVEGYNQKWEHFYDDYLADASEMLVKLEEMLLAFDGVEEQLRAMG